jgi:NitT/TauT family transport system permease protein
MNETIAPAVTVAPKPAASAPPAAPAPKAPRKAPALGRLLPIVGPIALFVIWDLVVRAGWIKAILLPPPEATLMAMFKGLAGGPLLLDFTVTVIRTLEAFAIAAVLGLPIGVLLGSNERAYRSVEFLIDFFRSTPSSALIPLFLLIFGVSDINKVAIAAFGAFLIVLFNSAYGVLNARKQRVMAAKVMGASRWRIFCDVLIWESLQASFVGLRSGLDGAGDRDRGGDVHRLRKRPGPPHHRYPAGPERARDVCRHPLGGRAGLCPQRGLHRH